MKTVTLLAAALLTGCASMPDYVGVATVHVSHPLEGWPVNDHSEYGLTTQDVYARWQTIHTRGARSYVEVSLGYNLDPAGFPGPRFTGGVRFGYEIPVRKGSY